VQDEGAAADLLFLEYWQTQREPDIAGSLRASQITKILRTPEVRQELAALGAEPVGDTSEEFAAFLKADMARWGKIIHEKGIRSDP
jgi:tripartite-type tricarboxylate transporter receptor subunit TctC